jgi:hypothetical protein
MVPKDLIFFTDFREVNRASLKSGGDPKNYQIFNFKNFYNSTTLTQDTTENINVARDFIDNSFVQAMPLPQLNQMRQDIGLESFTQNSYIEINSDNIAEYSIFCLLMQQNKSYQEKISFNSQEFENGLKNLASRIRDKKNPLKLDCFKKTLTVLEGLPNKIKEFKKYKQRNILIGALCLIPGLLFFIFLLKQSTEIEYFGVSMVLEIIQLGCLFFLSSIVFSTLIYFINKKLEKIFNPLLYEIKDLINLFDDRSSLNETLISLYDQFFLEPNKDWKKYSIFFVKTNLLITGLYIIFSFIFWEIEN